jgi:hypothetical protein
MNTSTGVLILLAFLVIAAVAYHVTAPSNVSGFRNAAAAEWGALSAASAEPGQMTCVGGGCGDPAPGAVSEWRALSAIGGEAPDGHTPYNPSGRRSGLRLHSERFTDGARAERNALAVLNGRRSGFCAGSQGGMYASTDNTCYVSGSAGSCSPPFAVCMNPRCRADFGCSAGGAYFRKPYINPVIASSGAAITIFP